MSEDTKPDISALREQMKLLKDRTESLLKKTEAIVEKLKNPPKIPLQRIEIVSMDPIAQLVFDGKKEPTE